MYPDGICKVTGRKYSKTVAFEDINYQLAQPDDKTAIFEALCDMYNSFDASIERAAFPNQPPCEQGRFQEQYHDCAAE